MTMCDTCVYIANKNSYTQSICMCLTRRKWYCYTPIYDICNKTNKKDRMNICQKIYPQLCVFRVRFIRKFSSEFCVDDFTSGLQSIFCSFFVSYHLLNNVNRTTLWKISFCEVRCKSEETYLCWLFPIRITF